MLNYYDLIMGSSNSSFLSVFNNVWKTEIASHNLPYTHALQIENGSRLRPLLFAWGYYANQIPKNNFFVANYALSIELLHKSSILLDDLIDDDIARHEKNTFHVEFSKSEALLYALYLLNRSVALMNEKDIKYNSLYTSELLKIIDNMARGGIQEIHSQNTVFNITDVKEIIDLETISLIKNSFVLGYKLSSNGDFDIPDDIINIGHSCGYCFQVLNDIEPFSAPDINQKYKGITNYDFSKQRKNIVVSFVYVACTSKERENLKKYSDFIYMNKLIEKYEVLPILLNEMEIQIDNIAQCISRLQSNNSVFYTDFKKFLSKIFIICYQKCNLVFDNKWLDH